MSKKVIYGIFDDEEVLLNSVKEVRSKDISIKEVYSPFPIHGLDHALGLKRTRLAIAAFIYGCIGLSLAALMIYYIMIIDWPQNIGGKPNAYWFVNMPSFVPIMFELTVFFAAHLMCWSYFAVNGLYPGAKAQNPDPRTTDDHFLMEVELEGDEAALTAKLQELGALEISKLEE